ncbi:MAG: DUF1269 domain-containing protein [Myxococcota bacterium]
MPTFIAICYPDMNRAHEVRLELAKLQQDYLVDLEDAVVAVKNEEGKVRLHQAVNMTASGAVRGGMWGTLIGLIFMNPLLGLGVGAAAGAVSGALTDIGIDDAMMTTVAEGLGDGTSALFVLVRRATPDKVVPEIQRFGGTIVQSNLSHEDESKLQAALNEARAAAADAG